MKLLTSERQEEISLSWHQRVANYGFRDQRLTNERKQDSKKSINFLSELAALKTGPDIISHLQRAGSELTIGDWFRAWYITEGTSDEEKVRILLEMMEEGIDNVSPGLLRGACYKNKVDSQIQNIAERCKPIEIPGIGAVALTSMPFCGVLVTSYLFKMLESQYETVICVNQSGYDPESKKYSIRVEAKNISAVLIVGLLAETGSGSGGYGGNRDVAGGQVSLSEKEIHELLQTPGLLKRLATADFPEGVRPTKEQFNAIAEGPKDAKQLLESVE